MPRPSLHMHRLDITDLLMVLLLSDNQQLWMQSPLSSNVDYAACNAYQPNSTRHCQRITWSACGQPVLQPELQQLHYWIAPLHRGA